MASKRQKLTDAKAQSRAVAKKQSTSVVPQTYTAKAEDEELLASMSRSPSLLAELKIIRALLQGSLDSNAHSREGAELLKVWNNMARTCAALFIQCSILVEAKSHEDMAEVCATLLREECGQSAVDEFNRLAAMTLNRTNLARLNEDAIAELPTDQKYDMGKLRAAYENASTTLSPEAELALCRFWIQKAITSEDWSGLILLLKQVQLLALSLISFGKYTGALLNTNASRVVSLALVAHVSTVLREHSDDFESAIDRFNEKLFSRHFQPRLESK